MADRSFCQHAGAARSAACSAGRSARWSAGRLGRVGRQPHRPALLRRQQPDACKGPRLADLDVMASTEGAPIPRVYGRARLAGQVIWATRFEEVSERQHRQGGGKGGRTTDDGDRVSATSPISPSALCEGADRPHRPHLGRRQAARPRRRHLSASIAAARTQDADRLIVAKEGAATRRPIAASPMWCSSACRSTDFGNRIPQFSFEVIRGRSGRSSAQVRAVTLIPGAHRVRLRPDDR